jgi:hypothetical protein
MQRFILISVTVNAEMEYRMDINETVAPNNQANEANVLWTLFRFDIKIGCKNHLMLNVIGLTKCKSIEVFFRMGKMKLYGHVNFSHRCGVLQEGDHILAINGQYLEGRTIEEVEQFIAESPVKMLLLVEFRVAGKMFSRCDLA